MLIKKVVLFSSSFSTLYMSKTTKKIVYDEEFSLDNQLDYWIWNKMCGFMKGYALNNLIKFKMAKYRTLLT